MHLHTEQGITPDRFVLLKYKDQFAILAGGHGGYLDADTWRRSTGIRSAELDGDVYFVKTLSGSEYALNLARVGFTGLTSNIWAQIEEIDTAKAVELVHEQGDIKFVLDSFLEKTDA